jgi:hypothetical protein
MRKGSRKGHGNLKLSSILSTARLSMSLIPLYSVPGKLNKLAGSRLHAQIRVVRMRPTP